MSPKNKNPSKYTPTSCFRNYTFLVYPESAPSEWFETLKGMSIPCVVSPLHTGEKKDDGSPKKDHYHVVITYQQKHSIAQALEIVQEVNGVPDLTHNFKKFVVGDLKYMLRYLCHLDEDENVKPHYSVDDVRVIGHLDYQLAIELDGDILDDLIEITDFIYEQHITNFAQFMSWCGHNNRKWFEIGATKSTFYITSLIKTVVYVD